jgi:hypothetical protein
MLVDGLGGCVACCTSSKGSCYGIGLPSALPNTEDRVAEIVLFNGAFGIFKANLGGLPPTLSFLKDTDSHLQHVRWLYHGTISEAMPARFD